MNAKNEKMMFAGTLIKEGKIETIEMLYKVLPKKVVAEIFGVSSSRFSNTKSNHPEEFKIYEVMRLSVALNVELCTLINVISNSLPVDEVATNTNNISH
ncbi:hypothetical protein EON73_03100 [bacterium]|nr:MAG: hypothetical protein EON73_03100 [bacterium]